MVHPPRVTSEFQCLPRLIDRKTRAAQRPHGNATPLCQRDQALPPASLSIAGAVRRGLLRGFPACSRGSSRGPVPVGGMFLYIYILFPGVQHSVWCIPAIFGCIPSFEHRISVSYLLDLSDVSSQLIDVLLCTGLWWTGPYSPNHWRHRRGGRNLPLHGIRRFSTRAALNGRAPNPVSCPASLC